MAGPGEPPEGTPEGVPGSSDDEYGSVVFDESFVRAARLQEFSARERMRDHAQAVRNRSHWARIGAPRQVLVLVLLIALAFGTAVYMGVRHPYKETPPPAADPLRTTLIPLAPTGTVVGSSARDLFDHSPAAQFGEGSEGVTLPAARKTQHFSESQVLAALAAAKEYVVKSSLDPGVLTGGDTRTTRVLLDPSQLAQYDQSLAHPQDDGRHAATGWLVRFDPSKVALANAPVRVRGTLSVTESAGALEVTADHTFVYPLRPARAGRSPSAGADEVSLFTVRREMRFRFDRDDLRDHHIEVTQANVQAGPESCAADAAGYLRPLLAGERAKDEGPAGTDPYATGRATASLCGVLAAGAMPTPTGRR
ncbi:hypothetical protein ACFU99_29965 [Streptomyces sp. NPDC057654]|uniref:SCO2583 family membrane protein n=1 Tax=Streptomyces sp. NPDC057654 TaxID=3346196 RepID=UPI0036CF02C9